MKQRIRVAVLFGGKSAEHEVSLQSAKNIIEALDPGKYKPVLVGIDKSGRWLFHDAGRYLLNETNPKLIALNRTGSPLAMVPEQKGKALVSLQSSDQRHIDVVFPVLHGPYGEDGTIQGLLRTLNVPYVGAGVLGSAVGMDKDVTKRLLRESGLPTNRSVAIRTPGELSFSKAKKMVGSPLFVKPANLGSSVGVSKCRNPKEYDAAVAQAFTYDRKVLIEEFVNGREIECAVLGNDEPVASIPGEIIPTGEFYSYNAKYIDEDGAALEIPAKLSVALTRKVQKLSVQAFRVLNLEGMARVDFFLKDNGTFILNEVNTIPGFTNVSMYPKLWEHSGLPYPKLIDQLIRLAMERFDKEQKLRTTTEMVKPHNKRENSGAG